MSAGGNRAVYLDRDGVLNQAIIRRGKPHPPSRVEDLVILTGVKPALQSLKAAGFLLIGVTNQPDVARGQQRREVVESINESLMASLPLDDLLVCYHDDADECRCRKPRPGLLLDAAEKYGIELARSYLVGDRWRDVEAGQNAGCSTIFIDCDYDERPPSRPPSFRARSLNEAATWILERRETGGAAT